MQSKRGRKPKTVEYEADASGKLVHKKNFEIDRIVDWKEEVTIDGTRRRLFLVKWRGYALEDATWEPEEHIPSDNHELQIFLQSSGNDPLYRMKTSCEDFYRQKVAKKRITNDPRIQLHLMFELENYERELRQFEESGMKAKEPGELGRDKIASVEFDSLKTNPETKEKELWLKIKWVQRTQGHLILTDTVVPHYELMRYEPNAMLEFYMAKIDFSNN